MTFPPRVWRPIAWGLSIVNVAAVWPAASAGEAWHATVHATLAVLLGLWALRMKGPPNGSRGRLSDSEAARLDALEQEMGVVRQELAEAHERLDFAERLLSQQRPDRLDAPP